MNRIGFPKPRMIEEKRIALLPIDIAKRVESPDLLFFEKGYGEEYDIPDSEYRATGANIVPTGKAYSLEVLCQPKFSAGDLPNMNTANQTVFGWLHLEKGSEITRFLQRKKDTAIAWEFMEVDGKNVFQRNGFLTGRMGVLHAIAYAGKIPEECSVAVIGRARVGKGAKQQLEHLRVKDLTVYHTGNSHLLKRNVGTYDIIVHAACSETNILESTDLERMKHGALLIHLGADCIEGDFGASSIYSPITPINEGRNLVYCVNHIPTIAYKTASRTISEDVAPYINQLVNGRLSRTLVESKVIDQGKVEKDKLCQ